MGLLRKLASTITGRGANRYLATAFNPWELSRGRLSATNFEVAVRAYTSWTYRCANLNANSVAQLALKLYSEKPTSSKMTARVNQIPVTSKTYESYLKNPALKNYIKKKDIEIEEIESHPFLDLMKNVNPQRNEFDLKNETELFLELTGNGYWYLVPSNLRGADGRYLPAEIWVLPSQRVTIVPSPTEFIDHFELRRQGFGNPVRYEPEEIVHFRFPNPNDVLYGMGPLQGARNAVDVNQYIRDYETNLFRNQARPDFIIKSEGKMNLDQRDRFMEIWKDTYRGTKSSGKFGVLEGGMDIKELGWSPKELSFLIGRNMTKEEICNIFGIPMSKVQTKDVNRANAEVGETTYQRDTISPRLRLIEQKITEKFLPIYDDKLFCVFEENIPLDKEFKVKERESNLKNAYSSINEERKLDGREPVAWGDVPLVQMNIVPLEVAGEKQIKELAGVISDNIKERLQNDQL